MSAQVDIWLTRPDDIVDGELLRAYEDLLSPEEYERHHRFLLPATRHSFLVSRALVRTSLSRYAHVAPAAWEFEANAHGKPFIKAPAGAALRFNLSHTDGLIACAVCREADVGIDVENVERPLRHLDIARSTFAPREFLELEALPEDQRRRCFFSFWTLKEAYAKARGTGLSLALERFWFEMDPALPIRIQFTGQLRDAPDSWTFERWQPTPRHVLALAVNVPPSQKLRVRVSNIVPLMPHDATHVRQTG